MTTLEHIVDLCKCSVTIEVNDYLDYYQTLEEGLQEAHDEWQVPADIIQEMRLRGRIVRLQVYPLTPVGFEHVYAGSVQGAIDRMYRLLMTGEQDE